MPEKEKHERHRIVVEEVESPREASLEEKSVEVIDENTKVSSEKLTSEKVQIVEEKPVENITPPQPSQQPALQNIPTQLPVKKQKSPIFWILVPGIFILGAVLGGVIFYQKGINTINVEESPTPVPTTVSSATPIPTSTPSVDISEFEIAIFNGSGTAGEAGKVKTLLETAGFTVASTGNAATYDYTDTIIKAKATVDKSVIDIIKTTLSKSYSVGNNETLSSSATTDIQVVVGSSKAE